MVVFGFGFDRWLMFGEVAALGQFESKRGNIRS